MKISKRWQILIIGAAILLVAFSNLVYCDSAALAGNRAVFDPLRGGLSFFFLTGWPNLIVVQVAYAAIIWAGFVLPSRRPHRRRAVWYILIGAIVLTLAGFRLGTIYGSLAVGRGNLIVGTLAALVSYAIGLVYLWRTRNDPDVQPRLDIAPPLPEPAENHLLVAAKIADDDHWRNNLFDSLAHTGQESTPPPKRWPLLVGLVVLLAGSRILDVLIDAVTAKMGPQLWVSYLETLIFVLCFAVPIAVVRRRWFQARAARQMDEKFRKSDKRPIFYLRSFGLDDAIGQPSIVDLLLTAQSFNREQVMTAQMRRTGPVIAIGRPEERLPALGAVRFYVSHDLWQEKVADVATVARLVVWASGTTPGLQWEISHLVRSLPPEKLILWAHPHLLDLDPAEREAEWSAFVDGLGQLFPKPLPKPLGKTEVFAFDADFTPIPFRSRLFRPVFRQVLAAKHIPPYDPESERKRARTRKGAAIIGGAVGGLVVLLLLFALLGRVWPGQPPANAWNLLASDLIDDEIGTTYPDTTPAPKADSDVIANFRTTDDALKGRWFGRSWQDVPPGRQAPLRRVAADEAAVWNIAHARPELEDMLYGRGPSLFMYVSTPTEAQEKLDQLSGLRAALAKAEQDWAGIISHDDPEGFYAQRLHNLITARQSLLEAEAAVLRAMVDHPGEWSLSVNEYGQKTIASPGYSTFYTMASGLFPVRNAAAAALRTLITGGNDASSASSSSSYDASSSYGSDYAASSSSTAYPGF